MDPGVGVFRNISRWYLDSTPVVDKAHAIRQGLPPTYRMRHDAHYVEELESRRRPVEAAAAALAFPTSIPVTFALRDMAQELEGVASCFNLVGVRARPLRERIGLSLARIGVQRNMRAFQALRVLLEDPPPERAHISLTAIVDEAVKSFEEELRVTEARAMLDLRDAPLRVNADARMLSVAVQSCLGTIVALAEAAGQGGAIHIATRQTDGVAYCELRQDMYRLAADQFARLTDLEWSDRPGGIPAGVGLAAAARIAQAHGGHLDARRTESGGCMLSFSVTSGI
jgi:signal transduction histidine kinase